MPSINSGFELTPRTILPQTPARETSQFFDSINNLDPVKYCPPSPNLIARIPVMANTHISYTSVANSNPFRDDRNTRLGDFYDVSERPKTPAKDGKHQPTYRHNGMSHSLSEGNVDFRCLGTQRPPEFHHLRLASNEIPIRLSEEIVVSPPLSPSRGRSGPRTPSPFKLEDIKEDLSPEEHPKNPPKRSRSPVKQLFGHNGWLRKSTSMKELPSEEYRKAGNSAFKHWGGKIKQRVEHLTEEMPKIDMSMLTLSPQKTKSPAKTRFYVSLTPPQQAKLYSEMELMICATANQYLQIQQREGRMSLESLSKVLQAWSSKNRPQVIEFLFDQATQRDLVLYNLKTFRFYGPHADNIISMNSMMAAWKALAREMSVRTFCSPDAVVKKNLMDAFKVLEMLGAPLVTIMAFKEIKERAEAIIEGKTKARDDYEKVQWGVERRWEPPAGAAMDDGFNPFA